MLNDRGSRRVSLSQIEVSPHLSPSVLRLFLARSSFLRDVKSLSDEALKIYMIQHPPVVYGAKRGKSRTQLMCIANLFPLYLARLRLAGSEKVRVTLVDAPLSKNTEALALSLALTSETCHSLPPKDLSHYIVSLWEHLASSDHKALTALSEKFNSKTSFCEALSINRRNV